MQQKWGIFIYNNSLFWPIKKWSFYKVNRANGQILYSISVLIDRQIFCHQVMINITLWICTTDFTYRLQNVGATQSVPQLIIFTLSNTQFIWCSVPHMIHIKWWNLSVAIEAIATVDSNPSCSKHSCIIVIQVINSLI